MCKNILKIDVCLLNELMDAWAVLYGRQPVIFMSEKTLKMFEECDYDVRTSESVPFGEVEFV